MTHIEDTIKTNIRVSKNMKERFKELAGEQDLQEKLEELVLEYNDAWDRVGMEQMLIASIRCQTQRKIAGLDDNKEEMQKDQILTLKTDKSVYDKFKSHCKELGVVFGEGIRRMINQAIVSQQENEYNAKVNSFMKEGQ